MNLLKSKIKKHVHILVQINFLDLVKKMEIGNSIHIEQLVSINMKKNV